MKKNLIALTLAALLSACSTPRKAPPGYEVDTAPNRDSTEWIGGKE
jgi:hypothetical protein